MIVDFIPGSFKAMREALRDAGPIEVVMLFRFREKASYAGGTDLPPASGRDVYFDRYMPAIEKIAKDHLPSGKLASIVYAGAFKGLMAGPADETWDYVLVVTWPDFEHPFILDTIPEYERDAAPHRRAALADFRVMTTQRFVPPSA